MKEREKQGGLSGVKKHPTGEVVAQPLERERERHQLVIGALCDITKS